jgi:hypothetical protein
LPGAADVFMKWAENSEIWYTGHDKKGRPVEVQVMPYKTPHALHPKYKPKGSKK